MTNKALYTQRTHRKRVDFRLPDLIITAAKKLCAEKEITFTNYIEMLIRADLKRRKKIISKEVIVKDWDNIEDMPAKPGSYFIECTNNEN